MVGGKRISYGESIRNEDSRLKLSAPVKGQNNGKISKRCNKWIMNSHHTNIRTINNSRIGLCKASASNDSSRLNRVVFNHEVKKVDNQPEPLNGESSCSYACENKRSNSQYQELYGSSADHHQDIDVSDIKESCFGYRINKNTSLNIVPSNENPITDTDDDDSEDEDSEDEDSEDEDSEDEDSEYEDGGNWSDAYVSEYNGLKMKISRKRKRGEDTDGSPLNAPLQKKINCATPLNKPLLNKINGTSPLNTPISKKINITSPLNTPLPKKINGKVY